MNNFLKNNGGMKNGVTGPDHTQFFFEVKNDVFSEAVKHFAEYLITPKFDYNMLRGQG